MSSCPEVQLLVCVVVENILELGAGAGGEEEKEGQEEGEERGEGGHAGWDTGVRLSYSWTHLET